MLGDVLDADGVLDGQTMGLAFHTSLVDQDTTISRQSSECQADVIVEHGDLADGTRILQLQGGFLFDTEHDDVLTLDADCTGASADSFQGVVYLEELKKR